MRIFRIGLILLYIFLSNNSIYGNDYLKEIDGFFVTQMRNKKSIPQSTIQNLVRIQNEFYKLNKFIDSTNNQEDKSFALYIQGFAFSIFDLTDLALESQLKINETKNNEFNYKYKKDLSNTYLELNDFDNFHKVQKDIFENYSKYHKELDTLKYYYSLFLMKKFENILEIKFKYLNENIKAFMRFKYYSFGMLKKYNEAVVFLAENKFISDDYNNEIKYIEEKGDSLYWKEIEIKLFNKNENGNKINDIFYGNSEYFVHSKFYISYWFNEVFQHFSKNLITNQYIYQKPFNNEDIKFSFIKVEGMPLIYFQCKSNVEIDKVFETLSEFKKNIHWQSSFDKKMNLSNEIIYFVKDSYYHFILTLEDAQRENIKIKFSNFSWKSL